MADDTPDARPASGSDARHPSAAVLRDHLEDRLDAADARRVQTHLENCDACLASLEVLEPPIEEMASPAGPTAGSEAGAAGAADAWDARRTRRAVRRTVLRTAVDAIAIVVLVVLGGNLLAWFVWHPLAIDRGDRITEHVAAAIDLPMLTIPGVEVSGYNSNVALLRRITEVSVERALGPAVVDLGSYTLRLGPLGTTSAPGEPPIAPFGPPLGGGFLDLTQVPFDADRLGPGTAVTAYLLWETPVGIDDTDELTQLADDLALLWVGFEQPDHPANAFVDPWGQLGYSACVALPDDLGGQGLGGGGFGRGGLRLFGRTQETGPPMR